MIKKDIENIVWSLTQAEKEENKTMPIIFLGAGASISAGIPGTAQIIEDIRTRYADKPEVKNSDPASLDYYKLMACLNLYERHELLKSYVENKKINCTHLYLAQMVKEGWIDYVLTVNFDDLFIRACALVDFHPAVYDISILKEFPNTNLPLKSVIHLHGKHDGVFMLNTSDEFQRVERNISTIFQKISSKRTWIILGYSGGDPVFDQIDTLNYFWRDLFWVGYGDIEPNNNVKNLLDKRGHGAFWVPGYDADSFIYKLHSALGMKAPKILGDSVQLIQLIQDMLSKIISSQGESTTEFGKLIYEAQIRVNDFARLIENYVEGMPFEILNKDKPVLALYKVEGIEAIVRKIENRQELRGRDYGANAKLREMVSILKYYLGMIKESFLG